MRTKKNWAKDCTGEDTRDPRPEREGMAMITMIMANHPRSNFPVAQQKPQLLVGIPKQPDHLIQQTKLEKLREWVATQQKAKESPYLHNTLHKMRHTRIDHSGNCKCHRNILILVG
jgi:hypothetical protein